MTVTPVEGEGVEGEGVEAGSGPLVPGEGVVGFDTLQSNKSHYKTC